MRFSYWDLTAISPTIISEETKPWFLADILPEGEISILKFNVCVETIVGEIVAESKLYAPPTPGNDSQDCGCASIGANASVRHPLPGGDCHVYNC